MSSPPAETEFVLQPHFDGQLSDEVRAELFASLREKLSRVSALADVRLRPSGFATVTVIVPAADEQDAGKFKRILQNTLDDWNVSETSSYGLPRSF